MPLHIHDQINDKNSFIYSSNQDLVYGKNELKDYLEKIGIF